jgi:hypothetical protein
MLGMPCTVNKGFSEDSRGQQKKFHTRDLGSGSSTITNDV